MYSVNGDAISKQYGGSNAMHSVAYQSDKNGSLKLEKWNNSGVYMQRYFNNISEKDIKKQ